MESGLACVSASCAGVTSVVGSTDRVGVAVEMGDWAMTWLVAIACGLLAVVMTWAHLGRISLQEYYYFDSCSRIPDVR